MTVRELIEVLNKIENKNRMVLIDAVEDYNPARSIKLLSKEKNPIDWIEGVLISY